MADRERNPKNAAGPFYVLNGQCISCDAPRHEAPGLVAFDEEAGCYFHRQPETDREVDDAIRAMFVSCVEAYRYAGADPTIRRRLAELSHGDLCDQPLVPDRFGKIARAVGGRALYQVIVDPRSGARWSSGSAEPL